MMRFSAVFAAFLLLSAPAPVLAHDSSSMAHDHNAETVVTPPEPCPPHCVRGTEEHDVWWCGFFSDKTKDDCEADEQIGCVWKDNACKPRPK